jgi:hypothetical protein
LSLPSLHPRTPERIANNTASKSKRIIKPINRQAGTRADCWCSSPGAWV